MAELTGVAISKERSGQRGRSRVHGEYLQLSMFPSGGTRAQTDILGVGGSRVDGDLYEVSEIITSVAHSALVDADMS